jgi:hypothetical protein
MNEYETWGKICPKAILPPQIPHELTWNRSRFSAELLEAERITRANWLTQLLSW